MPNLKISELAPAGALAGTELVEVVQGGVNKQTTTQDIADLGGGVGGAVDSVNSQTGVVVLDAGDVGADPAGTAAAAVVGLAPLASPTFTGTPTVPTAAQGTNTTQAASTAFVQAESIVDTNNENAIGQILNVNVASIPSHTDVSGAANFSNVSGRLRYAPTGTNLTTINGLDRAFKNGEIEIRFIVCPVTGITGATNGLRIGLYSLSPYGTVDISGGVVTTTTNPGSAYLTYYNDAAVFTTVPSSPISGDNLSLSGGDTVTLKYSFHPFGHRVQITKISNGRIVAYSDIFNSQDNVKGSFPPAWRLYIGGNGGEYDIELLTIKIWDKAVNDVVIIGDSITYRSIASSFDKAYAWIIKRFVKSAMICGFPAYTSTDILPYIPSIIASQTNKPVIILLIGANDAAGNGGATPTSWRTDFDAIVDLFIAGGWTKSQIIIVKLPPQTGANNTNVNTINGYIDTDYPDYERININTPLQVGGVATSLYFNGDLLHPNDKGHAYIARMIINSLLQRTDVGIANKQFAPNELLYLEGQYNTWTPGFTGFSANPTSVDATYFVNGKFMHVQISMTAGTSNATTFTITGLPIAPRRSVNQIQLIQNNTSTFAAGRVDIGSGSTTITCYATPAAGAWTASNLKACWINLCYEIA